MTLWITCDHTHHAVSCQATLRIPPDLPHHQVQAEAERVGWELRDDGDRCVEHRRLPVLTGPVITVAIPGRALGANRHGGAHWADAKPCEFVSATVVWPDLEEDAQ